MLNYCNNYKLQHNWWRGRTYKIAILGHVEAFSPESDSITMHLKRIDLFIIANKVEEYRKSAVSLSFVGKNVYATLRAFYAPQKKSNWRKHSLPTTSQGPSSLPNNITFISAVNIHQNLSLRSWRDYLPNVNCSEHQDHGTELLDFKMKESATAAKLTSHRVTTPKHSIVCYRFGGSHLANHCCFIKTVCHACGKKGHIASSLKGTTAKILDSQPRFF